MNNKEFINELANRIGYTSKEMSELVSSVISDITDNLQKSNTVSVTGFGVFDVKKKAERISVNPTTKKRMLIPPKLALNFKPSVLLKDKFK